jgi:hypothetical protein
MKYSILAVPPQRYQVTGKFDGVGHKLLMNTIIFHHLSSFGIYITGK